MKVRVMSKALAGYWYVIGKKYDVIDDINSSDLYYCQFELRSILKSDCEIIDLPILKAGMVVELQDESVAKVKAHKDGYDYIETIHIGSPVSSWDYNFVHETFSDLFITKVYEVDKSGDLCLIWTRSIESRSYRV